MEIPCVLCYTNKYNTLESRYPCPILDAVDVQLHGDVKAVEEVTPKHQSVLRGVYGMDPPCNVQNAQKLLKPILVVMVSYVCIYHTLTHLRG